MGPPPSTDGARVRIRYAVDGRDMEEDLFCVVSTMTTQARAGLLMEEQVHWVAESLFAFRTDRGHLDALAREGALFEDVTACAAWTKPSTACLFTSRPATEHGAQTVDDRLDEAQRNPRRSGSEWQLCVLFDTTFLVGLQRQTSRKVPARALEFLRADPHASQRHQSF